MTEAANPHVHVYLCLKKQLRRKTLMNICMMDARVAKGDAEDTKKYTVSAGPPLLEFGSPPSQGKRTDIRKVVDMIREGKKDAEILEESDAAVRMVSSLNKIRFAFTAKRCETLARPMVVGQWIWGPTHCGKSHRAYVENPGALFFDCDNGNTIWFDGYAGQKTIVLDELGMISAKQMKRIVDRWPYRCPVKGSFTYAEWTKVVVTSNYSPEEVFTDHRDYDAIMRRFDIIKMEEPYIGPIEMEL